MKERAHYWILLAQLNPIPVATGAVLLLLLLGLFLFQRRRAKATRRVKGVAKTKKTTETASTPASTQSESVQTPGSSIPEGAAITTPIAASDRAVEEISDVVATSPVVAPPVVPVDDGRRERVARVAEEAKKVFAGSAYDESIIGSEDRETRRLVGAELLSALVGRNMPRRERAREAFMKHGYFDDATRDLRVAESANERAAAARRLSFVHNPEATPHLIGALGDPAPDVRRAAVEALMDLRDPSAIAPLNSLMQTENDRKVPRTLIKHAIDACATGTPGEVSPPADSDLTPAPLTQPAPQPVDSEREVIEI